MICNRLVHQMHYTLMVNCSNDVRNFHTDYSSYEEGRVYFTDQIMTYGLDWNFMDQ